MVSTHGCVWMGKSELSMKNMSIKMYWMHREQETRRYRQVEVKIE